VTFDCTHFTDPSGKHVYIFKVVWLQGYGCMRMREDGPGARPIVEGEERFARIKNSFVRHSGAARIVEVYNIGGGRANSCSIWEAFSITEKFSGKQQVYQYLDDNRSGDHICYISNLAKMRAHYPAWDITVSLEETIHQIVEAWR